MRSTLRVSSGVSVFETKFLLGPNYSFRFFPDLDANPNSVCNKHPDQAAVTMKTLCPKCMSEIDAKALNMTLVELLPCGSRGAVRRSVCHAL